MRILYPSLKSAMTSALCKAFSKASRVQFIRAKQNASEELDRFGKLDMHDRKCLPDSSTEGCVVTSSTMNDGGGFPRA